MKRIAIILSITLVHITLVNGQIILSGTTANTEFSIKPSAYKCYVRGSSFGDWKEVERDMVGSVIPTDN